MKTTWNIIHKETNKLTNKDNITSLKIKGQVIHNKITIAIELNNYFLHPVIRDPVPCCPFEVLNPLYNSV